jgi:chromosome segregation ATPase
MTDYSYEDDWNTISDLKEKLEAREKDIEELNDEIKELKKKLEAKTAEAGDWYRIIQETDSKLIVLTASVLNINQHIAELRGALRLILIS